MVDYLGPATTPPAFDPKDPDDVDVYRYDFRNRIGAATISSQTVTAETGITVDGDMLALSDQAVDVTLSGGTAGTTYLVSVEVTLSDARVLEYSARVPVRER